MDWEDWMVSSQAAGAWSGVPAGKTFVKVKGTRLGRFIEFEFSINDEHLPALSAEPANSGWQGERGFVHEVAQRLFKNSFEGQTAYLCGPPPVIEACNNALMQGRLFEKHIFLERFLTQGDAAARSKSPFFKRL